MATRLQLGAPGIYQLPPEPIQALTGARMDVCAFVGVAPRGPARTPLYVGAEWLDSPCDGDRHSWPRAVAVPVESFDAYRRLFGGFEGPGLLPYAVASFFENGGIRAYVTRIVPAYKADPGQADARTAKGTLLRDKPPNEVPGDDPLTTTSAIPVRLRARSEGRWGSALSAALSFSTRPMDVQPGTLTSLRIAADRELAAGSLLQIVYAGGATTMRFVTGVRDEWDPAQPRATLQRWADLSSALPLSLSPDARVTLVEAALVLDDADGREERHEGLGLSSIHPRWLAKVVYQESILAYPMQDWIDEDLDIRADLAPYQARFSGGADDFRSIAAADFFDPEWVAGDPCPGNGIQSLAHLPELAAIAVPDLYSPAPLVERQHVATLPRCGPTFERSFPMAPPPPPLPPEQDLDGLRLDPEADLDSIIALQTSVVDFAEEIGIIALLDVPPRLHRREILRWRGRFSSPYAAAYHPWLRVSRLDDARSALIRVNPSAVAAGIIAQRELALGIPHGPANVIAQGVVDVDDLVTPSFHAEAHPLGINVYLKERDGVRLTAARTLSADPAYRQLSVRRLVTMLRRTLDQQMQWAVFEPNDEALRRDLRQLLSAYLGELFRLNAFTGAIESEAFFVRCDEELNPPRVVDAGQLLCEVGVAPAEPLEFIVLRIERGGDGTIRVRGH